MPRITHQDIAQFINEAIEEQQFDSCFDMLKGLRPVDIADALELVDNEHAWRILDRLPKRAEIFSYSEDARQVELTRHFPRATLARLISEMPADERTDLFKMMDKEQRDNLLPGLAQAERDRKSTRLNSSHVRISYAVFCLKKKKKKNKKNTKYRHS